MKNCSLLFNTQVNKEDSYLYKDLVRQYKDASKADHIYDNIIMSDIYSEDSFLGWLDSKGDFEVTSQGEPRIEEFMDWTRHLKRKSSLEKVFVTNNITSTVEEFISVSEAITSYLPVVLKEKGLTFNDWAEGLVRSENIRNNALNKMLDALQQNVNEELEIDNDSEFANRIQLLIDEIKANKEIFFDAYNGYLDATFRIIFENDGNEESEGTLDENIQDNEEGKQTKDTAFDKSSIEFSTKENAPKAIKLMIGSLMQPNELNALGLPTLVDYNKVFNLLHDELANVPGDIDTYISLIKSSYHRIPALEQLVDQLNFYKGTFTYSQDPEQMFREQRLRTQFINQFDKTKYDYTLHIKNRDGSYQVIDSNLDKSQNVKIAEWESNFKQQIAENPSFYTLENFNSRIKKMGKYELLRTLGIQSENPTLLPDSLITDIEKYGMATFEDFLTIYDKKGKGDVRARLMKLAENEIRNDDNVVELQHYNAEGKLVYGISLNSYLSDRTKKLGYYAGNAEALKQYFPELYDDPFIGSSTFAEWIKEGKKISIGISTGMKNESKNTSSDTSELNRRDITVQKIFSLLKEGQYNFMRAADRKIENIFSFSELGKEIKGREALIVDGRNDAIMYLVNHLYDEVQTNMHYDLGVDVLNIKGFDPNTTRVFTNNKGTNLIKKIGFDRLSGMTVDDMMDNSEIVSFISNKVDEIVETEKQYFASQFITSTDVAELISTYGSYNDVVSQYALNGYMANLEIAKIYTGDPLLYGSPSNFFKRMSMLNSTKESTRVDPEMNSFIESLSNNMEIAQGYTDGRKGSTIRTVTMQDIVSNMDRYSQEERDSLNEILGTLKGYNGINEADGFAYITYDEYRIMKIRYSDWDIIDEELYQKITSGEDYVIEEKYYNRIRPDKSQFVGKLQNEELSSYNMIGGRKFSFMPLVPGLFKKGSVLDKMNNDMLANGVGMAFMESAAKFGTRSKDGKVPSNTLYDKDGSYIMNIQEDTIDILDYSQIGNQLRIDKKEKTQQTESTQKRKLNLSNFYENGKLRDSEMQKLLDEYDDIQGEKVRRAYKTLETRLGFNKENREEKLRIFVNSLTNMGKLQGFTTNELLALDELMNLPFLDILPNKQRIEQFVMAKLRSTTISQKRKGSSMAQASNVGFELPGGLTRHDLKFYRLSQADKNGKKRLLPMEVYSPLPKELMSYVSEVYNNGKGLTLKALDAFNEDIAKDNENYEKTGEMTTLTKITMFVGFRIPNQGPSSSDVGKVKAFYPPHIGSIVVVPKAMVVKTGSDFDIDKLNMYLPDIKVTKDLDNKIANKMIDKYLSRKIVTEALRNEEIGYDYEKQSYETLKEWFTDNILAVPRENLLNSRYKLYNDLYKTMLGSDTKGKVGLEYITPSTPISEMNDRELNNKALENEIAITLSEPNWKQLLTPLDTTNIKDIVKLIRKLTGYQEERNMSDIFLPSKNTDKMIEFLSGKAGVGQVAVHNTNHILAQKAGLKMKNPHDYFKISDDSGIIDLGKIYNEDGILISEILSELLTAYVDIAKDPYILDINAINSTANTILMMVRQGIGLKKIFYLMNQPIIKEYLNEQSVENSLSINSFSNKEKQVNNALAKFGLNVPMRNMIWHTEMTLEANGTGRRLGKIYSDFTIKELEENISNGGRDKQVQLKALDVFLEMQRQSTKFQEMIRSTSPDTQGFKSFTMLENQLAIRDRVRAGDIFVNYENMFQNFIGDFWKVKNDFKMGTSEYFLAQLPGYKVQLDSLKSMVADVVRNPEIEEKQILQIENDFIFFLLSKEGVINHSEDFGNLFKGEKSIPKLLKKLQKEYYKNDTPNRFLEMALPLINERNQGYDSVKPRVKKISGLEKEAIYPAYKELGNPKYQQYFNSLLKLPPGSDFYGMMNKYFMMQTGINNSPYNMVNFIPARDYANMLRPVITRASEGNMDISPYVELYGEGVGLYVMNNLSLFFKKDRGLPFKVIWHPDVSRFSITIPTERGELKLWQRGSNNYLDYGMMSQKVSQPSTDETNTLDKDNPLNCPSNKK